MPTWTYAGSPADGLRWSQRALTVLGDDAVALLSSIDAGGILSAFQRIRSLADERTAAAQVAAAEGVETDDAEAMQAAMQAVQDVAPADVLRVVVDRLRSPEALELVLDAAALCAVDGERFDPEAPCDMTLAQIGYGVAEALRGQAVFR
jgi:hypothetical protein